MVKVTGEDFLIGVLVGAILIGVLQTGAGIALGKTLSFR